MPESDARSVGLSVVHPRTAALERVRGCVTVTQKRGNAHHHLASNAHIYYITSREQSTRCRVCKAEDRREREGWARDKMIKGETEDD